MANSEIVEVTELLKLLRKMTHEKKEEVYKMILAIGELKNFFGI